MNRSKLSLATLLAAAVVAVSACAPTAHSRSTGQYIDDQALAARVKSALIEAPQVSAGDVEVETYNGVVQLSGFVDSSNQADAAVAAVQKVPGVRQVKNNMLVKK